MKKRSMWFWLNRHWRVIAVWAVLVGATVLLFTWKLTSLPGGVSTGESTYLSSIDSARQLLQSPAFLPHKLLTYLLTRAEAHHIAFFRLVSVTFALAAVFSIYYILQRWYTKRVALLGSLLFASSSLVLHISRSATPEVTYLLLAPIIALGLFLQSTKRHWAALLLLLGTLCLTIYIPGFIWLAVAVAVWQGRRIARVVKRLPWPRKLLCLVLVAVLLAPAVASLIFHPREIYTVLGLPTHLENVSFYWHRLGSTLIALVWHYNDADPAQWVRGTAIFDIFTLAMITLGVYSLRYEHKLMRGRLQAGLSVLFWIMIVTGGPVTFIALTPVLYLLAGGGIAFLLQQWFTVFPRNPVARFVAIVLICAGAGLCSYFHVYRYFVAWPHNQQTKRAVMGSYLVK